MGKVVESGAAGVGKRSVWPMREWRDSLAPPQPLLHYLVLRCHWKSSRNSRLRTEVADYGGSFCFVKVDRIVTPSAQRGQPSSTAS